MKYADDLCAKLLRDAAFYGELAIPDMFIEEVAFSICHSIKKYWTSNPQVSPTGILFKTKSLLAIQNGVRLCRTLEIETL